MTSTLAVLALAPLLGSSAARPAVQHVPVGGRTVRVDLYAPQNNARSAPTVLLFHGVGGMFGDGAFMRRAARALAERGFRAGVVHYFNVTGTFFVSPGHVRELAPRWKDAIPVVTRHVAKDGPVGVLGYSLGGFLAVGAAAETPEIGAVAALSSGILAEHEDAKPGRLPPLLILHGESDSKVPVDRARALARLAERAGDAPELVVYPGEGHAFSSRAERDALDRAARFFAERLGAGAGW